MKKVIIVFVLILIVALVDFRFFRSSGSSFKDSMTEFKDAKAENSSTSSQVNAQIANPASEFCIKNGGNLQIEKKEDGSEYGLCYFDDARACEEWAMMRGDCPVGGRKTTGYDTIDQKFCAWSGGETFAVANSVCTFKSGKKCSTVDFYNGNCKN